VEAALAGRLFDELPEGLIGDKAYYSHALDEQLAGAHGIETISLNLSNCKPKTRDGGPMHRTASTGRRNGSLYGCTAAVRWSVDGISHRSFPSFVKLTRLLTLLEHLRHGFFASIDDLHADINRQFGRDSKQIPIRFHDDRVNRPFDGITLGPN
jgi:hypothetical protein